MIRPNWCTQSSYVEIPALDPINLVLVAREVSLFVKIYLVVLFLKSSDIVSEF